MGNAKNDDGKPLTYGDVIPGNSFSELNERFSDILKDTKNELENFTTWELALLLARAADLQTDKVTETFLKAGHTKISDYWNNKLRRKSLSFRNFFARKEIYSLIKKRIESEEGGKLFLSKIKEAFDKKGMGELL